MKTGLNWKRLLAGLGIAVLQFISTQVVTFVVSLLIPIMNFPQNYPVIFTILLGLCFSTGVFLTGWLALKQGWLKAEPKLPARLAGTLIGAYLPLIVALLIVHPLGPNPWFFISMAVSVIGFHIPGFFKIKNVIFKVNHKQTSEIIKSSAFSFTIDQCFPSP